MSQSISVNARSGARSFSHREFGVRSFAVAGSAMAGAWGTRAVDLIRFVREGSSEPAFEAALVPGFTGSSFNPLVFHCLKALKSAGALLDPEHTAVVVASLLGDTWTADSTSQGIIEGRRLSPLLFYQSVPVSILGMAARALGLQGPLVTLSAERDPWTDLIDMAETLLDAEEASTVVLLTAAAHASQRTRAVYRLLGSAEDGALESDAAFALALRRDPYEEADAVVESAAKPSAVPGVVRRGARLSPTSIVVRRKSASSHQAAPLSLPWPLPPETRTLGGLCVAVDLLASKPDPAAFRVPLPLSWKGGAGWRST